MPKWLRQNAQLGSDAQQWRHQKLRRAQRRRHQATMFQDVSRSARVGLEKFAAEAELADHLGDGFGIHKALRANVEAEAILIDSIDDAAEARTSLQQEHRQTELFQAPCARQPGNSAADDWNLGDGGH